MTLILAHLGKRNSNYGSDWNWKKGPRDLPQQKTNGKGSGGTALSGQLSHQQRSPSKPLRSGEILQGHKSIKLRGTGGVHQRDGMCTQLHTKDISYGATSHLPIPWLTSGRQNPSPESLSVSCCWKQRLVLQASPYRAWTQAAIDILHIVHARNNHTPCPGILLQRSTFYLTDPDGGKVLTKAAKGNSYPYTPLKGKPKDSNLYTWHCPLKEPLHPEDQRPAHLSLRAPVHLWRQPYPKWPRLANGTSKAPSPSGCWSRWPVALQRSHSVQKASQYGLKIIPWCSSKPQLSTLCFQLSCVFHGWLLYLLYAGRSAWGEKVGGKSYAVLGKLSLLRNLSFDSPNQELISPHCSLCLDVAHYALLGK